MDRPKLSIHQTAEIFYLSLQSFVYYSFLHFFSIRFDLPLFPAWSIIWVLLVTWLVYFILFYSASKIRWIGAIFLFLIGVISGILIFDQVFINILLMIGILFFALRRAIAFEPISHEKFFRFFVLSILYYFLFIIICYIASYSAEEIQFTIRFLIISLLTALVGIGMTQLYPYLEYADKRFFWRDWGIVNGWKWVGLGLLGFAGFVLLLIIVFIYNLTKPIISWLFLKVFYLIFNALSGLQGKYWEIYNKKNKLKLGKSEALKLQTHPTNPVVELIIKIVTIGIIVLIVLLLIYVIYRVTKKVTNTVTQKQDIILRSVLVDGEKTKPSFWKKNKSLFTPFSLKEKHRVRESYRELLMFLRKQHKWHSTLTVEEVNGIIPKLEKSSMIYQKFRYGDQELTQEEIEICTNEINQIIKQEKVKNLRI